jgi:LytS/YehU family sensor histidine kinase
MLDVPAFLAITGTLHAVSHARLQQHLREEALVLRADLADARLAVLQHRIHPHFLFNTLNSVAMLIRTGDADSAVAVLARLSALIRELVRDHQSHEVPLAQEFHFLGEYLALERIRFGDRLEARLELAPSLEEIPVPFLLLQPLVENAVRYGVAARSGPSVLTVDATRIDSRVLLRVEERGESGQARTVEPGHGMGLAYVRERLATQYGDEAALTLDVEETGSRADVTLPVGRAQAE